MQISCRQVISQWLNNWCACNCHRALNRILYLHWKFYKMWLYLISYITKVPLMFVVTWTALGQTVGSSYLYCWFLHSACPQPIKQGTRMYHMDNKWTVKVNYYGLIIQNRHDQYHCLYNNHLYLLTTKL